MLNNNFSLLQYTRWTAHMARRKCSNWKRKTTKSSFYLLATMTMPMPLPQQPTTIARFCSHFTNYVGRWEHYFNKNRNGPVFLWLCDRIKLTSDTASEREREGARQLGRGIERGRERKAKNSTSEWVLFFFRKRRAINFMLFSCFCYAIAFARIFCPTPTISSALGKAITLNLNLIFFCVLVLNFCEWFWVVHFVIFFPVNTNCPV